MIRVVNALFAAVFERLQRGLDFGECQTVRERSHRLAGVEHLLSLDRHRRKPAS